MRRQQLHFAAVVAAIVVTAWVAHMRGGVGQSEAKGWQFEAVPIDGAVGPESFSFDPRGEGPYTGVSDGRIIKWHQTQNRWLNFSAIASSSHWCAFSLSFSLFISKIGNLLVKLIACLI